MTQLKVYILAFLGLLLAFSPVGADAAGYAEGDMTLGSAAAPVKIIEYASMTCPHCAHFADETFEAFKKKYIDTGKVYFTFREFPFDQYALQASMLARCAGPSRYFAMISILFRQQTQWARAQNPTGALEKIARLAGISKKDFDHCMADQKLMDQILSTRLKGHEDFGIDSTPSFIVNGDKYSGAMDLQEWDKILAKYLN